MSPQEEKIYNNIKLTIIFLITMLGVAMFEEMIMIVLLLFYIAFIKG
tara:strand:+ start:367 stop:507 length:141 start_codon:yes stop_codon:yes gene_type:complete